ncbi:PRA1 family protein 3 [Teleopsis dalmanni]|uniref:PRA1 family protein 3 n=1 Tax=Teleopsis dalmanni TaxID=139649 RepID=UPI0018CF80BF|nr:PRA1 family protein 3 [Teleopsis dalmanni]
MTNSGNFGLSSDSAQTLQLPPLRSLDDFVLGSARFQLPNLQDLEKWGNRVVKNLLYYQTNYFLMFVTIYGIILICNPLKIFSGLMVQIVTIAIYINFFRVCSISKLNFASRYAPVKANPQLKWYFMAIGLICGYLVLYWLEAILVSMFAFFFPFSIIFLHSSLRLRNIKNKVVNTMESLNINTSTPMGIFLDTFNIKAESFLS